MRWEGIHHRGEISVSLRVRGRSVELVVADTGIGNPAAELPQIFERFYRVPGVQARSHEGSGIGLAIRPAVAGQHGGSVRVESQLGQGTTFVVSIPLGCSSSAGRPGRQRERTGHWSLRAGQSLIARGHAVAPDFARRCLLSANSGPIGRIDLPSAPPARAAAMAGEQIGVRASSGLMTTQTLREYVRACSPTAIR